MSTTPTWVYFAFLVVAAVVYYFVGKLVLLIAGLVIAIKIWLWLCRRFPRTMGFVFFFRGLFSRRR